MRVAGYLKKAAAAAQINVFSGHLGRIPFFRTLSDETLTTVAKLMRLRVCAPGDRAAPSEQPDALLFVAKGAIHVPASVPPAKPHIPGVRVEKPTPAHIVTHDSTRCWCNEDVLINRPPRSSPPVAISTATLLMVEAEMFADLRAALPTFAATAGSSTLVAMRESLGMHATLVHKERRNELYVTTAQRSEESRAAAIIGRWERLTFLLMPQKESVHSTFSMHVADYQSKRKAQVSLHVTRSPTLVFADYHPRRTAQPHTSVTPVESL